MGLVLEKLVHELGAADAVLFAGEPGKVEVRDLTGEEGLVERPFGQRELEVAGLRGGGTRPASLSMRQPHAQQGSARQAGGEEGAAIRTRIIH